MTPAAATRPTSADLRALLALHEPPCVSGLAEGTLRTGGEVIVLEAARMPSKAGAAAIFRY